MLTYIESVILNVHNFIADFEQVIKFETNQQLRYSCTDMHLVSIRRGIVKFTWYFFYFG